MKRWPADPSDPFEGYRQLYRIYDGTSGLLDELKPFFRLPGIEPDGNLHVNDQFRALSGVCQVSGFGASGRRPPPVLQPNDTAWHRCGGNHVETASESRPSSQRA